MHTGLPWKVVRQAEGGGALGVEKTEVAFFFLFRAETGALTQTCAPTVRYFRGDGDPAFHAGRIRGPGGGSGRRVLLRLGWGNQKRANPHRWHSQ